MDEILPMGARGTLAAEDTTRLWEEVVGERKRLWAIQIDVGQPLGGLAEDDADILLTARKVRGKVSDGQAKLLPTFNDGSLRLIGNGNGSQSTLDVSPCRHNDPLSVFLTHRRPTPSGLIAANIGLLMLNQLNEGHPWRMGTDIQHQHERAEFAVIYRQAPVANQPQVVVEFR